MDNTSFHWWMRSESGNYKILSDQKNSTSLENVHPQKEREKGFLGGNIAQACYILSSKRGILPRDFANHTDLFKKSNAVSALLCSQLNLDGGKHSDCCWFCLRSICMAPAHRPDIKRIMDFKLTFFRVCVWPDRKSVIQAGVLWKSQPLKKRTKAYLFWVVAWKGETRKQCPWKAYF